VLSERTPLALLAPWCFASPLSLAARWQSLSLSHDQNKHAADCRRQNEKREK